MASGKNAAKRFSRNATPAIALAAYFEYASMMYSVIALTTQNVPKPTNARATVGPSNGLYDTTSKRNRTSLPRDQQDLLTAPMSCCSSGNLRIRGRNYSWACFQPPVRQHLVNCKWTALGISGFFINIPVSSCTQRPVEESRDNGDGEM